MDFDLIQRGKNMLLKPLHQLMSDKKAKVSTNCLLMNN